MGGRKKKEKLGESYWSGNSLRNPVGLPTLTEFRSNASRIVIEYGLRVEYLEPQNEAFCFIVEIALVMFIFKK